MRRHSFVASYASEVPFLEGRLFFFWLWGLTAPEIVVFHLLASAKASKILPEDVQGHRDLFQGEIEVQESCGCR